MMTTEPAWLGRARRQLGVRETPGPVSNASILRYREMAKIAELRGDDGDVPWCAIFVNAMLEVEGVRGTRSAMARSFLRYGTALPLDAPPPAGAIAVFSSARGPASGHVTFAAGWSANHVLCLGGNQGDMVKIAPFPRARLIGLVWPSGVAIPRERLALGAPAAAAAQVSDA